MKKATVFSLALAALVALPAQAADCGQAPIDMPQVPNGATATAGDIRLARDRVLAYSATVDEFIACMERRATLVSPYMTKEQLTRRQEDLNDLHNERRDLQIKLNEAIRAFRQAGRS